MPLLPAELLYTTLDVILCRESQTRQLTTLLGTFSPPVLVAHGPAAAGKSLTISTVLKSIATPSAIVPSIECITTRHLLERTLASIEEALEQKGEHGGDGRCESISTFVVQLQQILEGKGTFILVFDGIDRQREAAPTLLPAIARLGEIIPNLTTILIVATPLPHLLHHSSLPHVHFPPYTRPETLSILTRTPLSLRQRSPSPSSSEEDVCTSTKDEDSAWLWTRFTAAVWDSLGQSYARDLISFRSVCTRLWQPFIQPILNGHYSAREFSKLMVRNRALFQSEAALTESIVSLPAITADAVKPTKHQTPTLPYYPSHLLISAYLASHSPPRHDLTLFSKTSLTRRRKRGGGTALTPNRPSKHRSKISRKLLGPQPFPLERLFAIFHAILPHDMKGGGADVMCEIATLLSLKLVVRAGMGGGGDVLGEGAGKLRCGVGWEFVSEVARGVRFDIESYMLE